MCFTTSKNHGFTCRWGRLSYYTRKHNYEVLIGNEDRYEEGNKPSKNEGLTTKNSTISLDGSRVCEQKGFVKRF